MGRCCTRCTRTAERRPWAAQGGVRRSGTVTGGLPVPFRDVLRVALRSVGDTAATSPARRRTEGLVRALRGWSWWPEMGIIAAVAFAFHGTLAGTAHLPYDAEFFHYPLLRAVEGMLSGGHLPVWDNYTYGGAPLLANAQAAWLYPPNVLLTGVLYLVGRPLTEHSLDIVVVAHIALAGLGMCAVAKRRGLGASAALFAGIFVVLSGETIAQSQHVLMVET